MTLIGLTLGEITELKGSFFGTVSFPPCWGASTSYSHGIKALNFRLIL